MAAAAAAAALLYDSEEPDRVSTMTGEPERALGKQMFMYTCSGAPPLPPQPPPPLPRTDGEAGESLSVEQSLMKLMREDDAIEATSNVNTDDEADVDGAGEGTEELSMSLRRSTR